jgi:hypothetical protein
MIGDLAMGKSAVEREKAKIAEIKGFYEHADAMGDDAGESGGDGASRCGDDASEHFPAEPVMVDKYDDTKRGDGGYVFEEADVDAGAGADAEAKAQGATGNAGAAKTKASSSSSSGQEHT